MKFTKKIKYLGALMGLVSAAPTNFRSVQSLGDSRFLESAQCPLTDLQLIKGIAPTMSIDADTGNLFFQYVKEGRISFQRIAANQGSMAFAMIDAAKEFLYVNSITEVAYPAGGCALNRQCVQKFTTNFKNMQIEISLRGIALCLYNNNGRILRFNYRPDCGAFKDQDGRLMTIRPDNSAIVCIHEYHSVSLRDHFCAKLSERAPHTNRAYYDLILRDLGFLHFLSPFKPLAKDPSLKIITKDDQEIILPSEVTKRIKAFWPTDNAPFVNALLRSAPALAGL